MASWKEALARTRDALLGGLAKLVRSGSVPTPEELDRLESDLIGADIPPRLAAQWMETLRKPAREQSVQARLAGLMREQFSDHAPYAWSGAVSPRVILLTGVNGSGKTTTAAKLAALCRRMGKSPLLAAADTFRAAGSGQLEIWAGRVGCPVVGGERGQDAAAVAFDAIRAGMARGCDVVIVDTAGRMHTRRPLIDELQKMVRSIGKAMDGAPHDRWVVLDASLGQNAITQARVFHEAVGLTGVIVTKLDGSSKGGFIISIFRELKIPVLFAGLGEGMHDLSPFEPDAFVSGITGAG